MNREEILRNLEYAYERLKDKPTFTGEINVGCMISDVISFIKENTDDWTPVSDDTLPDKDVDVNVTLKDFTETRTGFYSEGDWWLITKEGMLENYPLGYVMAWKPLPKPYKGGDTE